MTEPTSDTDDMDEKNPKKEKNIYDELAELVAAYRDTREILAAEEAAQAVNPAFRQQTLLDFAQLAKGVNKGHLVEKMEGRLEVPAEVVTTPADQGKTTQPLSNKATAKSK